MFRQQKDFDIIVQLNTEHHKVFQAKALLVLEQKKLLEIKTHSNVDHFE